MSKMESPLILSCSSEGQQEEISTSTIWSKVVTSSQFLKTGGGDQQQHAFRRKFHQAVEYHCQSKKKESPLTSGSSIVPSDLQDLTVGQGRPVESLGVIVELKKASSFSVGSSSSSSSTSASPASASASEGIIKERVEGERSSLINPQRLSDLSRKLVERWIAGDCCAEALTKLCLGEDASLVVAEVSGISFSN
jgi:hypothetical protein